MKATATKHSNIMSLLPNKNELYLLMPWMYGTLEDLIKERKHPASLKSTKALLFQLADACNHLENANVVHCDLKPENILMSANARPCISDFGSAHYIGEEIVNTGTYGYESPNLIPLKEAKPSCMSITYDFIIYGEYYFIKF